MLKEQELYTVTIEDLTHQGEGVGKVEGFPLFIPGTIPGDLVKVRVDKKRKNFGHASLVELIEPSEDRVESVCPYHHHCGGCQTLTLKYEAQLKYKDKKVRDAIQRIGKINKEIRPILGMKEPYRYRNKAQFPIGLEDGETVIGFFQRGSHDIVSIDDCKIQHPFNKDVIKMLKKYIRENKVSIYNEKTGKGLLRHLVTKVGFQSEEQMLILVINGESLPKEKELIAQITQAFPHVKSIVINKNTKKTNVIMGSKNRVLYGREYIVDTLCNLEFQISPHAFYQVNPIQTEILYEQVVEMAALEGNETVLDVYCGIGTISLLMARTAEKVIGVENVEAAVQDARINAKRNHITNAEFHAADAEVFIPELAMQKAKPEVVVVDPPRKGCDEAVLEAMVTLSPQKIVYVSCNPSTLARDLKYLEDKGYNVEIIQPVDLFSNTVHVETVVLLSHKKADTDINVNVEFGEGEGKIPVGKIVEKAEDQRPSERVTYKTIQEYIESKYGFKVHTSYIAEVKKDLGLPMHDAPNAVEELKNPKKHPTPEKVKAIKDALKYFAII
ncbi:23S rRNA (uracil(1939)-C(5))-methyltransferase RlmD [Tindallia magadiensis]|nr:23S rRNA (uracil(1939)-C(5))-methyltransferase RlmD [Tindallia magadiensis]